MNKPKMSVEDVVRQACMKSIGAITLRNDGLSSQEECVKDVDGAIQQALDQLYELLVSEAKDFDTGVVLTSMPPIQVFKKAIPLESINRLFGKGE